MEQMVRVQLRDVNHKDEFVRKVKEVARSNSHASLFCYYSFW